MKRPLFTPESRNDLDRILDHIARDDVAAALRMIDRIQRACRQLAKSPGIGIRYDEVIANLHIWPVRRYLVFYRPVAEGIQVLRVIHGARDWERLLDETNLD